MSRIIPFLCLSLLTTFGNRALAAETTAADLTLAAGAASARIETVGVPADFADLAGPRELLVDVYFGGRKVGETRIVAAPGEVRIKSPREVLALIPNVITSADLTSAAADPLPSNAALVCAASESHDCGSLSPETIGVIFDEQRFRLDVFVNPRFLHLISPHEQPYLPVPTAPLSLAASTGVALSGSNEGSPTYNVQNRAVVGFRNSRLRAETSYSSEFGFVADTVVGELDGPGRRYSAGLFWAPGLDLTGRRRIVGVGVATQFDTRADRENLIGSPVIVFLTHAAQVDLLVDGRLVESRLYDAGNNVIDTSRLPDGSYPLVLRIHDPSGAVREERRLFTKNEAIPPVGHPVYFAYAGWLANTRRGTPVSLSNDLFYQLGAARRVNNSLALDLSVIGTTRKPLAEVGASMLTSLGRVRVAGLVSPAGDTGVLVQFASSNVGPLSANFDLRRVWSHDGRPLIPLTTYINTFDSVPLDQRQFGDGSYTQASGSIGYSFGSAYIAVIGSLRKDEGRDPDYSVGPNLNWPVFQRGGLQVTLQADAQLTRNTTSSYVGVRMFFTGGHGVSVSGSAGARDLSADQPDSSRSGAVGDLTAHFSQADVAGTDVSLSAGLARELDSSAAHADGTVYSRYGSARAALLHDLDSNHLQYGVSLQTGTVVNRDDVVFGGRNLTESGLVIAVDGKTDAEFEVLIDGQPRGHVSAGDRLPIFLPPYHAYSVRLRPTHAQSVWFDEGARTFVLYPGNVQHVLWHAEKLLTLFGRAVREDGTVVADASVKSSRAIGESDAQGYFQIQAADHDRISLQTSAGETCTIDVDDSSSDRDYAALGRVLCR